MRIYNAWAKDKSDENWQNVVSAAQRTMESNPDETQGGPFDKSL